LNGITPHPASRKGEWLADHALMLGGIGLVLIYALILVAPIFV
jgi:hypothetical protein